MSIKSILVPLTGLNRALVAQRAEALGLPVWTPEHLKSEEDVAMQMVSTPPEQRTISMPGMMMIRPSGRR